MRINLKISKKAKNVSKKTVSQLLAFSLLSQSLFIPLSLAHPGGPSQPEVQSFTPAGVTDMVDPFTGDFTYNIPLLEVDGYPINITYHSGVTMDQEASWVGLGWNINPGVIQRSMRGIPDDFNGDEIIKEMNMEPSVTKGVTLSANPEIFGLKTESKFLEQLQKVITLGTTLTYNNYSGFGMENSFNIGINSGEDAYGPLNLGLGISSSSENGLSLSAKPGLNVRYKRQQDHFELGAGWSAEATYNSREGLKEINSHAGFNYNGLHYSTTSFGMNSKFGSYFNLGGHTYIPQVTIPMYNTSYTGNFQFGGEFYGFHGNIAVGGFYSSQKMMTHRQSNPSYGYMNSEEGQMNDNAILDFNREKDEMYYDNMKLLPVTNFTYDIYSVSGQGISGSYRPFRSDLGYVFDPGTYSKSNSQSIGFDVGIGNYVHVGEDISTTDVTTNSGVWNSDNNAMNNLTFRKGTGNPLYEKFYFKEANEKTVDADPSFMTAAGGFNPKSIHLWKQGDFQTVLDNNFHEGQVSLNPNNYRKERERRNQYFSFLTRGEIAQYGLENPQKQNLYAGASAHHIGEITITKNDGIRYVYGIPAYNLLTEECTFAVGAPRNSSTINPVNPSKGLVSYSPNQDNSLKNKLGIDHYFSNTILPPYTHSYLLSALLSADYVDSDTLRGPSDSDMGNYTKFYYSKINNFKWRIPFEKDKASYNEGLRTDPHDDKGNYIYGEKELWYLDSIVTKNQIALFVLERRKDGHAVKGVNGGIDTTKSMKLLRTIKLFSKPDYRKNKNQAIPLKEVHFVYDYSLCPGTPDNSLKPQNVAGLGDINQKKGKLTLKKIYFTYQNSFKGKWSPYLFNYTSFNPSYNIKSSDRWGNFKPNVLFPIMGSTYPCSNSDFPYVLQNKDSADLYSQAWNLEEIALPYGGKTKIFYESDDYGYVQNKRAGQMFKIISVTTDSENTPDTLNDSVSIGKKFKLWFKLNGNIKDPEEYFQDIDQLYFKFLIDTKFLKYEYISGYTSIESKGISGNYGWVTLKSVSLDDSGDKMYNPIVKTAIQYARLNLSKYILGEFFEDPDNTSFGEEILRELTRKSLASGISEAIDGPNQYIYNKGFCRTALLNQSFIRLSNPNKRKFGGGCRVKKILNNDEWDKMTAQVEDSFEYGMEYEYKNTDGSSSGVASYEPGIGGDENSLHTPIFYDVEKPGVPDENFYQEEPVGESFFPAPMVGYRRVTIKNIKRTNVSRHGTGSTVQEFYTAKEFPVITKRTNLADNFYRDRDSDHFTFKSLFNINFRDYLTASQGYYIELNDMHGKPKSKMTLNEENDTLSSMEYRYKTHPYLNGSFTLDNTATVVNKNGFTDTTATIGIFHDFITDLRESNTSVSSNTDQANLDVIEIFGFPIPIALYWPSHSREQTRFRSAVTTKVIQRFGNLEEVISKDLGSTISVKNLAYDAETGDVLLTETVNNFNDPVYKLNFPAYWHYDGMGAASKNNGAIMGKVYFSNGMGVISNATKYFSPGDQIALSGTQKGWVIEVNNNSIKAMDDSGNLLSGMISPVKIITSGRKNQLQEKMTTLICKTNPLNKITSNLYENVIDVSATEFSQGWRSYCDCPGKSGGVNSYLSGNMGLWRPKRAYSFLTGREISNYNNNSNIRKDGTLKSYIPLFQLKSGKWQMDERDWTFAAEVTEFNPAGGELENKDALGRYGASQYGYNQSLLVASASNSRYHETGYDGFEDHNFNPCSDNHFRIGDTSKNIVETESHSGKNSLRVTNGSPVEMIKQLEWCDNNACQIDFVESKNSVTGENSISVSGGLPPYQFEWKILDGELIVKVSDTGDGISYKMINSNPGKIKMSLTVRDKNDCKGIFNLEVTNP